MKDTWLKTSIDFYNKEAKEKASPKRHQLVAHSYRAVAEKLDIKPGLKILDAGCGCGEMTGALSPMGFTITGIDVSIVSLKQAKKYYPSKAFICADIHFLPFKAHVFDAATAISSLEFCANKKKALKELRNTLKSNANMYLDVRNRDFILFSILKPVHRYFEKYGLIKPFPAENFKDLNREEWKDMISSSGMGIKKVCRSIWPWRFGSFSTRAKNLLIFFIQILFPVRYHYMIGLVISRGE